MKHTAIFLKSSGEKNYYVLGKKRYKPEQDTIAYKDRTFILPKKDETYRTDREIFIFFNYEKSTVLSFTNSDFGIDAKFLDMLLTKNIIAQMVSKIRSSMDKPDKWKILPYLASFGFGAVTGFLIYQVYMKTYYGQWILWLLSLC